MPPIGDHSILQDRYLYDELLADYRDHISLVYDLTLEVTRYCNRIEDSARLRPLQRPGRRAQPRPSSPPIGVPNRIGAPPAPTGPTCPAWLVSRRVRRDRTTPRPECRYPAVRSAGSPTSPSESAHRVDANRSLLQPHAWGPDRVLAFLDETTEKLPRSRWTT